ncbi:hypothetical protein [Pseudoduganella sp. RAF53_2]|uniref:hypothetical protein n=1 Tax=unclassified Pseudoduganella TaxID=2637179 RepID=UPI003F9B75C9
MSDLLQLSPTLIKIIARINPYIWEVVGGGPLGKRVQIAAIAADPEPSPWLQAQLAAVEIGQRQVDAASAIQTQNGDARPFLKAVLDDWCGTPYPHPHFPHNWSTGLGEPRPPRPNELDAYTLPILGAIAMIRQSESIANESLSKALAETGAAMIQRATTHALEHQRELR